MKESNRFGGLEPYRRSFERIKKNKPAVVIFGWGQIGRKVYSRLVECGIPVKAILDNNRSLQGGEYSETPILPPEKLAATTQPVVICSVEYYAELAAQAEALKMAQVMPFMLFLDHKGAHKALLRAWQSILRKNNPPGAVDSLKLESVDLVITEKCSLRCRDCANLMQYFKTPRHSDFGELALALDRLFKAVDYIHELRVLGGEPFVNPELAEYLKVFETYDNFDWLVVYTNATVIPKPHELAALKSPRSIVSLSDYRQPAQKIARLAGIFEENAITYEINEYMDWQDCGRIRRHDRTRAQNEQILANCCVSRTLSLKNGKLYRCPFAGSAAALSAVPRELDTGVDLVRENLPAELLRERIRRMLAAPFLEVCDYCAGRHLLRGSVRAAEQTTAPLEYRVYD